MKKYITITAFSLSLAILANMTGCSHSGSLSGISDSEVSTPESTAESTDSSENVYEAPKHELSDEAKALGEKLKQQSFVGPDGEEVVYLNDAADIYIDETKGRYYDNDLQMDENGEYILDEEGYPKYKDDELVEAVIKFDFGYMRYSRPYFYCTKDGIPDADQLDSLDKQFSELPEKKWFKIRVGDKLDCGLTVKSVEYLRYPIVHTPLIHQKVEFDGELTLDGVLFITTNPNDYFTGGGAGWLEFFPDTSKATVPVFSTFYDGEEDVKIRNYLDKYYVESDFGAFPWLVGHIDEGDVDRPSIFGDEGAAMVRVTLKNLNVYSCDAPFTTNEFRGEIVDIERID